MAMASVAATIARSFARPRLSRAMRESRGKTKEGKATLAKQTAGGGGERDGRGEGPQKYETLVRNGRRTGGWTARKRNSCGDRSGGRIRGGGREKERRRSPWLDIKNVSCGNLTTGEGRRGARCGRRFARKAREGCVKKHGRNEREEEPPGGRADRDRGRGGRRRRKEGVARCVGYGRGTRSTRIFTTSTRLRLHTWRLGLTALILKNCRLSRSLLPPPIARLPIPPIVLPPHPTSSSRPDPLPSLARPFACPPCLRPTPKNEIAPLYTVGDKVLDAPPGRSDPPPPPPPPLQPFLRPPTDNPRPRHPRGR